MNKNIVHDIFGDEVVSIKILKSPRIGVNDLLLPEVIVRLVIKKEGKKYAIPLHTDNGEEFIREKEYGRIIDRLVKIGRIDPGIAYDGYEYEYITGKELFKISFYKYKDGNYELGIENQSEFWCTALIIDEMFDKLK